MKEYRLTEYFENEVLRKRPYIKKEWCIRVVERPRKTEPQEHNRYRFWAAIDELEGRMLRVVTLEDKTTIHQMSPLSETPCFSYGEETMVAALVATAFSHCSHINNFLYLKT